MAMRTVWAVLVFWGAARAGQETSWEKLIADGSQAVVDRRYGEAEKAFQAALNQLDGTPESDYRYADTLHHLSAVFLHQGRLAEAERLCLRTIAIRQKNFDNGVPLATSELVLGILYRTMGRYADSEYWTRRAVAIYEKQTDLQRGDLGAPYHSLALVLMAQRKFTAAEKAAVRAADAWPPEDLENRVNRAAVLMTLGNIYAARREFGRSVQHATEGLAILESVYGRAHRNLIPSLSNFADLHLILKKFVEAEKLGRRALDIAEATLGKQSLDWANAALAIGRALAGQSRMVEADLFFRDAISVVEHLLGRNSPTYGRALQAYAELLRRTKRVKQAKEVEEHAAAILSVREHTVDVTELRQRVK
jgi:tetratricopeptide (TPR) repeat protein